jgi:hypothetical protein
LGLLDLVLHRDLSDL